MNFTLPHVFSFFPPSIFHFFFSQLSPVGAVPVSPPNCQREATTRSFRGRQRVGVSSSSTSYPPLCFITFFSLAELPRFSLRKVRTVFTPAGLPRIFQLDQRLFRSKVSYFPRTPPLLSDPLTFPLTSPFHCRFFRIAPAAVPRWVESFRRFQVPSTPPPEFLLSLKNQALVAGTAPTYPRLHLRRCNRSHLFTPLPPPPPALLQFGNMPVRDSVFKTSGSDVRATLFC